MLCSRLFIINCLCSARNGVRIKPSRGGGGACISPTSVSLSNDQAQSIIADRCQPSPLVPWHVDVGGAHTRTAVRLLMPPTCSIFTAISHSVEMAHNESLSPECLRLPPLPMPCPSHSNRTVMCRHASSTGGKHAPQRLLIE